jgi:hypothetical protein
MSASPSPPPGWHPDRGGWRWWDGTSWGEWRPADSPAPAAANTGLGVLAHLGGLLAGFVVPLIVFLTADHQDHFLRENSAEALNFQITITIGSLAVMILSVPVALVTLGLGLLVLVPAFIVALIAALVFMIQGAVVASRGEVYRYPVNIRLVQP